MFNDTSTTDIYTLSLHDALPIWKGDHVPARQHSHRLGPPRENREGPGRVDLLRQDRKSTRLNSSHSQISYAVFCLKKKNDVWSEEGEVVYRIQVRPVVVVDGGTV